MNITCINNLISDYIKNTKKEPKTPKKVENWETWNENKELVPLSESQKVFFNKNPKRINRRFEKEAQEGFDFFYVGKQPLFRLGGMIYWYAIGDYEFDIRDMRQIAGLKEDYAADRDHANIQTGLLLVAQQLDKALEGFESLSDFFTPAVVAADEFELPF